MPWNATTEAPSVPMKPSVTPIITPNGTARLRSSRARIAATSSAATGKISFWSRPMAVR